MSISFNSIPINLRVPGAFVEIVNSQAFQKLPQMPSRLLVFGQMFNTGSAAPNVPVLVPTGSGNSAQTPAALFGRGSMLAQMCQFIKAANPWTELWAMPLSDNGAGTQAAASVIITAGPTVNGTVQLYINGTLVQAAVTAGMTAAQVATALQAAIAAVQVDLAITAIIDGGNAAKINFTAAHKGADAGNTMKVMTTIYPTDVQPAGIAFTTAVFAGGAANPDLTAALAALGNQWFTDWIMPYTDGTSLTAVTNAIEALWGPMAMKDARVWNATIGSLGTLATFGAALDEKLMTVMGVQGPPQPAYLWAAVYGAVGAFYLSIDPVRQIATLPLPGIIPPPQGARFVLTDRNTLLYDGIATFKVDDGGNVLIERAITTYRTNPAGDLDPSYLDIETLAGLAYFRYAVRTRIAQKFPRYKLAADGTAFDPGQAVVTPSVVKNEIIALFSELVTAGIVQDIDGFKAALIVELDDGDPNTVDALMPPKLVDNFRIFKGQVAFSL